MKTHFSTDFLKNTFEDNAPLWFTIEIIIPTFKASQILSIKRTVFALNGNKQNLPGPMRIVIVNLKGY